MLMVTRRAGEAILIGDHIKVHVAAIGERQVKIGIEAPLDLLVLRDELEVERPRQRPKGP